MPQTPAQGRASATLPAPPKLPIFDKTKQDLIPLGRIAGEEGERVVGVSTADTFFSYVAGRRMTIEQAPPGSALDDQLRREQAKAIFDLLLPDQRRTPKAR